MQSNRLEEECLPVGITMASEYTSLIVPIMRNVSHDWVQIKWEIYIKWTTMRIKCNKLLMYYLQKSSNHRETKAFFCQSTVVLIQEEPHLLGNKQEQNMNCCSPG